MHNCRPNCGWASNRPENLGKMEVETQLHTTDHRGHQTVIYFSPLMLLFKAEYWSVDHKISYRWKCYLMLKVPRYFETSCQPLLIISSGCQKLHRSTRIQRHLEENTSDFIISTNGTNTYSERMIKTLSIVYLQGQHLMQCASISAGTVMTRFSYHIHIYIYIYIQNWHLKYSAKISSGAVMTKL